MPFNKCKVYESWKNRNIVLWPLIMQQHESIMWQMYNEIMITNRFDIVTYLQTANIPWSCENTRMSLSANCFANESYVSQCSPRPWHKNINALKSKVKYMILSTVVCNTTSRQAAIELKNRNDVMRHAKELQNTLDLSLASSICRISCCY